MVIEVNTIRSWALVFSGLLSTNAIANSVFLPELPAASLSGYTGNGWAALGDAMAPLLGSPLNFTYVNPQVYYHNNPNEYSANIGVGQRRLMGGGIWGAYVFGDYNHSADNQNFWFVSPGIERLGSIWDFSANGYIPVTQSRIHTGTEFADQAGDFSQVHFAGHDQYDQLVDTFDSTGWGADAQIGAHLPWRGIKLSLGGYFFTPQASNDIIGGAVRAEVPLNGYLSLSVSEAYDNLAHNTLKAGLSLSLGGRHRGTGFTDDLTQRLVDPVQRQLIAVSGSAHTGEPVVASIKDTGKTAVELDNISFFVPDTTSSSGVASGDGTYENPYNGFSQENVNNANQQNNRNFYLNSGEYNPEYAEGDSEIILNDDQVYGRQNNFTQSAQGDSRPVLNFSQSGFKVGVNDSTDSVNDLILTGANGGLGIDIQHSANNSHVQTIGIANVNVSGFATGIYLSNSSVRASHIIISNANIDGNSNDGITAQNQGSGGMSLQVENSTIKNNGSMGINLMDYQAGPLTVDISHSIISNNGNDGIYALNLENSDTLTLNVTHSTITSNGYDGVQIYNGTSSYGTNSGDIVSNISDSNISGNLGSGISASNTSTGSLTLNIENSSINSNIHDGINAVNINDSGSFSLNLRDSIVSGNQSNGLEVFNQNSSGTFNLAVVDSVIAHNTLDGIFMDNSDSTGDLIATIFGSKINGNGSNGVYALDDFNTGSLQLTITRSTIAGNTKSGIFVDNHGNSVDVDIAHTLIRNNGINGINALNESQNGSLDLSITHSLIANNQLNGIMLSKTSMAGTTTAEVTSSALINNRNNAIAANNGVYATINNSMVWGNGIAVKNGAVIMINNPIYFNGDINNHGGVIQFNGADVPAGATHATCILGICRFSI